jgi:hypothetical protein
LAAVFMVTSMYFAWRSFYRMRIGGVAMVPEELASFATQSR